MESLHVRIKLIRITITCFSRCRGNSAYVFDRRDMDRENLGILQHVLGISIEIREIFVYDH